MGILSGLARFGLGKLEDMELYEEPKKEDGGAEAKKAPAAVQEQDFLFDKSCTCPICDKEFKSRTVKVGKAKLSGSDLDLRPRYEQIDLLKYTIFNGHGGSSAGKHFGSRPSESFQLYCKAFYCGYA